MDKLNNSNWVCQILKIEKYSNCSISQLVAADSEANENWQNSLSKDELSTNEN